MHLVPMPLVGCLPLGRHTDATGGPFDLHVYTLEKDDVLPEYQQYTCLRSGST